MSQNYSEGTIQRLLSKSPDVLIFSLKSRDRFPMYIKVKRFRPKSVPTDAWARMIEPFAEGNHVYVIGHMESEKLTDGAGVVQQTTAGRDIWVPFIVADKIFQISAVIEFEVQEAAPSKPDVPAPPRAPAAPAAPVSRRVEPLQQPVSGRVRTVEESDDGLPTSPFQSIE